MKNKYENIARAIMQEEERANTEIVVAITIQNNQTYRLNIQNCPPQGDTETLGEFYSNPVSSHFVLHQRITQAAGYTSDNEFAIAHTRKEASQLLENKAIAERRELYHALQKAARGTSTRISQLETIMEKK